MCTKTKAQAVAERLFRVLITDHADELALIEFEARDAADARELVETLIAHGHTVLGMCDGIDSDGCEDIEGYDTCAIAQRADALDIKLIAGEASLEDDLRVLDAWEYTPDAKPTGKKTEKAEAWKD